MYFTGWRIDATRELTGPGSELGPLLIRLARRGVAIRLVLAITAAPGADLEAVG